MANTITTGFKLSTGQDLGTRYVSKDYLIDVYPNILPPGYITPQLIAWGKNDLGALGIGNNTSQSSPVQVGTLTTWRTVSAGRDYTLAVKYDGTMWAWGTASIYQLPLGYAISAGSYSSPIQVGALTNWRNVTAGYQNGFALKSDGTMWAWGVTGSGLGIGATGGNYSSPVQVGTLTNWKQISTNNAAAFSTTLAVKTDGTLWAWGNNQTYGLMGLGISSTTNYSSPIQVGTLTTWQQVSVAALHWMAVKTDGTLWGCGANANGNLGDGTNANRSSPVQVGTLTNWKQVACNFNNTVAIKTDGTLWVWGNNSFGQLGNNTNGVATSVSSPIQVGTLTNWKYVQVRGYDPTGGISQGATTIAIKTDGTLWAWGGQNVYGWNGQNNLTSVSSPIQIGTLTTWKTVSGGDSHIMAIADGSF